MPLFSSKFSPKGTTPRKVHSVRKKSTDSGTSIDKDNQTISLKLGDQETLFDSDTGQWIPETGPVSSAHRENIRLTKNVQRLEEENNQLRLKFEILLDLLTQTTAEVHVREKELELLKNQSSHRRMK